jgi:4'-phosphopantetheinyl transferase
MASVEVLWNPPPKIIELQSGEIHVWCVDLDGLSAQVNQLIQLLTPDEQARANIFKHEQARMRFVVGRATLRELLGEYAGLDPSSLKFNYSSRGKPELANSGGERLTFNVSHSGELALIAVGRLFPLGVDIERLRSARHDLAIAKRFFSQRESTVLESLTEAERPVAFMTLWTRKEAWLKATGSGITGKLDGAEMTFQAGERARIISIDGSRTEAERWTLVDLKPANGFVGALAAKACSLNVRCWHRVK